MGVRYTEEEILGLEEKYWSALRDLDAETAVRLSGDPCIVAGASGVGSLTRDQLSEMMKGANWKLHDFTISDFLFEQLTDDVVVVAYKVTEHLTVDGKPLALDAADSSTWIRRDGEWICSLHAEAPLGDPFGRDRQAEPTS